MVSLEVFLAWVLQEGAPPSTLRARMQRLLLVLEDIVVQLPASSVQVERQHANIQLDASAHRFVPKRPGAIQADSYIMSCVLEHADLFRHVDQEVLGSGARRRRVSAAMRNRKVDSAAPGEGLSMRRAGLTEEGTVKGRPGLLKGLLCESELCWRSLFSLVLYLHLVPALTQSLCLCRSNPLFQKAWSIPCCLRSVRCGSARKEQTKTRRVSGFNAFQQKHKRLGIITRL